MEGMGASEEEGKREEEEEVGDEVGGDIWG
jgi:hypothetical protein